MGSDVRIFEVGPRDGLQNESAILSVEKRAELIKKLIDAGARDIEVGSFVHPRWVPQMADTDALVRSLEPVEGVNYWSLIPNMKGMERALEVGVTHAAFFISASDTHNRKNLNKGIEESLHEFEEMFAVAKQHDLTVRAYVSMVFGCPYEGQIDFGRVMDLSGTLLEMGAAMISLGDTVGIGTPVQVRRDCARAIEAYGEERIALHLHDTRGMGVTNAMVAYDVGMRCFDSSVGGIGGCPFAPGAAGNLGTEDLLYLLDSLGVNTGMSVASLSEIALWLEESADIDIPSRCSNYLQSRRKDL
ncbi:MAG: hydroxymethylglutaryl-CoA lyase [Myxococcota bacterium]|nr:hydroxymethylglutaryl-CoA lyase [Myxococcota bacterium]